MELGSQIREMVFALAAVLALMLALAWVARRFRGSHQYSSGDLEVLGSAHVGPKERILLVRVHDRQFLLGVGPQNICALGEFDDTQRTSESC